MSRKHQTTPESTIGSGSSYVGEVHGDYHSNGGKDRAILEQEKNVQYSLDVLLSELQKYHRQIERKDRYIRDVVKASFDLTAEKDKRIEDLIKIVLDLNAAIAKREERAQAIADRLVLLLEKQ